MPAPPNSRYKVPTVKNSGTLPRRQSTNNNQKPPSNSFYCGAFSWGLSAIVLNVGSSFFVELLRPIKKVELQVLLIQKARAFQYVSLFDTESKMQ
jgi:hypothetical protein